MPEIPRTKSVPRTSARISLSLTSPARDRNGEKKGWTVRGLPLRRPSPRSHLHPSRHVKPPPFRAEQHRRLFPCPQFGLELGASIGPSDTRFVDNEPVGATAKLEWTKKPPPPPRIPDDVVVDPAYAGLCPEVRVCSDESAPLSCLGLLSVGLSSSSLLIFLSFSLSLFPRRSSGRGRPRPPAPSARPLRDRR